MVRSFRADQKVNVDKAGLSCGVETDLNIGEDELDIWNPPILLELQDSLLVLGQVVVRDTDCADRRGFHLKAIEIGAPGIGTPKLVV